jgi:signal peptidase I
MDHEYEQERALSGQEPDLDRSASKPRKQRTRGQRILREIIEILIVLAVAIVVSALLKTFVVDQYEIPTGSMEPTIMGNNQVKDRIFAEKVSVNFALPQPGDIITFKDPTEEGRILIKRCIAVGGQTIDLKSGRVIIDGKVLDEPYTHGKPSEPLDQMRGVTITYPYTIPADSVWVMGDNRTNSLDSRHFGAIPKEDLVGKALFRSWPFDRFGAIE